MSQTLFLIISALGLMAAVGTILARNLVHAALYLVAFFFIVACQFVLLEAEFLAVIQVLVYIGAVAILLMFGIMLTRNVQGDVTTTASPAWSIPAVVAGVAVCAALLFGINDHIGLRGQAPWSATSTRPSIATNPGEAPSARAAAVNNMAKGVGDEMMTRFVVPFEVAGLLLTAALVGAIALAHREGDEDSAPRSGARASASTNAPNGSGNGHAHGGSAPSAVVSTTSN